MKKILLLTSALLMMVSCQKEATKEDEAPKKDSEK